MLNPRRRIVAMVILTAVALTACGDDSEPEASESEPSASESGSAAGSEAPEPSPTPEDTSLLLACPPDVAAIAPPDLPPENCWSLPGAENPVLAAGTLFALMPHPNDADAPPSLMALNPETGELLWESGPLPGAVSAMAAADVDGAEGVAVVVTEDDAGDALTESSQAWGYLAWTADAGAEDERSVAPVVHLNAPITEGGHTEVFWTDQGVLAGDQFLAPGGDAFIQVNRDPEPMIVGDYDLDESFAGVSGGLLLSYVRGVAWTPDGPEAGESYVGWLARNAEGTEAWNTVESTPNEGDAPLFAEGPTQLAIVVGDDVLTITPTDENYTAFELTWLDAATHKATTPTAADLAGVQPIAAASEVMSQTGALLSPDGRHLFAFWSTLALIVDVEAGKVTRIPTDFDIRGVSIDDTTVYGTTENGNVAIDLATAKATSIEPSREVFSTVDNEFGALVVGDKLSETLSLVGGRREAVG